MGTVCAEKPRRGRPRRLHRHETGPVSLPQNHGERRTPLLLLDDIFDKLDAGRVSCIVDYVSGEDFGQIFITDTNRDHLDRILAATHRDYRLFVVENGRLTSEPTSTPDNETQKR